MSKLKVIGICGSKGAGKTTVYQMLKEVYGDLLQEVPLADHLKETCAKVSGLKLEYFVSQDLKERELENYVVLTEDRIKSIFEAFNLKEGEDYKYDENVRPHISRVFYTPRQMLQYVGTEVLRPIDPLIHVKTVIAKCQEGKVAVVPDVRFNSEFDYFSKNSDSFLPLYVNNNDAEAAAATDGHKSELEFRDFAGKCFKIDNNGTLHQLRDNALAVTKGRI